MGLFRKNSLGGRVVLATGLLLIAALLTTACETTQRQKVLTFFFDGVPDPNAKAEVLSTDQKPIKPRKGFQPVVRNMFKHEPYELKDCGDCHKSARSQALLKPEPRLCYDCHGKMLKRMTFVHKPAEEGTCKACHLAHESVHLFLLPKPEIDLCNDCHDPVNNKQFVHTPIARGSCSTCHDPHGGKNAMYTKHEGDAHCADCHEPEKMRTLDAHQNIGEQTCITCHDPHQSDIKGLLKPPASL